MDQHQAPEGFREGLPFRLLVDGVAKHAQAVPVHPASPAAKGTRAPFSPAAAAPDPRLSTLLPGGFPASHELGSAASNALREAGRREPVKLAQPRNFFCAVVGAFQHKAAPALLALHCVETLLGQDPSRQGQRAQVLKGG